MSKRTTQLLALTAVLALTGPAVAQEQPVQPDQPAQPAQPAEPEQPADPSTETPVSPADPAEATAETPEASAEAPAAENAVPAPEPEPQPVEDAEVSDSRSLQTVESTEPYEAPQVSIGPHIGLLIPQLFGELGSWPVFGLELGYILPFDAGSMERPLQLNFDVLYSRPGAKGTEPAPAIGEDGTEFEWQLREQILVLELSGLWRFMRPRDGLSAFATAGPRLYLMESVMSASADGNDFGENRETKTQVGFVVGGGVEYALGPGSIFGALEFGWSDLKQRITGDSNTGALVLDVGYRFLF